MPLVTTTARQEALREKYDAMRQLNPYKDLREYLDLTQDELSELAHCSPGYIYRQENGLINTPAGGIGEALISGFDELYEARGVISTIFRSILSLDQTFQQPIRYDTSSVQYVNRSLEELYEVWAKSMRGLVFKTTRMLFNNVYDSPSEYLMAYFSAHRGVTFAKFMKEYTADLSSILTPSRPTSKQAFSRFLVMHPRNWQLFVAGKTLRMPPELRRVLIECGIPEDFIKLIEETEFSNALMKATS